MASINPIVCTSDELDAARLARAAFVRGDRKVRVVIDGDVTEWANATLKEVNDTITGMQAYQNSISATAITAFSITASKGF